MSSINQNLEVPNMYVKTICPHCEKSSFNDIVVTMEVSKRDARLSEVEIKDTLREEDLIKIVAEFIAQNVENGMNTNDLSALLNRCLGISPQFTEELILKVQNKKACKKAI